MTDQYVSIEDFFSTIEMYHSTSFACHLSLFLSVHNFSGDSSKLKFLSFSAEMCHVVVE